MARSIPYWKVAVPGALIVTLGWIGFQPHEPRIVEELINVQSVEEAVVVEELFIQPEIEPYAETPQKVVTHKTVSSVEILPTPTRESVETAIPTSSVAYAPEPQVETTPIVPMLPAPAVQNPRVQEAPIIQESTPIVMPDKPTSSKAVAVTPTPPKELETVAPHSTPRKEPEPKDIPPFSLTFIASYFDENGYRVIIGDGDSVPMGTSVTFAWDTGGREPIICKMESQVFGEEEHMMESGTRTVLAKEPFSMKITCRGEITKQEESQSISIIVTHYGQD